MMSIRRSAGSKSPPDETYFKTLVPYYDEAVATTSIEDALGGNCVFGRVGFLAEIHDQTKVDTITRRMKC
jgi:hypothetical protein